MTADAALRAARQGDLSAFNRLVLEHQTAVYNLAYRLLDDENAAAEATQAAFVSALRGLRADHVGAFKLWVLRCLVQACRPRLGRRVGPVALPAGLAALPPGPALALGLVDIAGLNYAEAAAVLSLSHAQLCCDLAAARRALAAMLVPG
jgi:DNA-directed RNA polymerase specialized sigma24 family protein